MLSCWGMDIASDPADARYVAATYIRDHTSADDRIFVIGDPVVYFLADRRPAIRHFFMVHHYPQYANILDITEQTPKDFRAEPPAYILVQTNPAYAKIPRLEQYAKKNCRFEARVGGPITGNFPKGSRGTIHYKMYRCDGD